MKQFNVKALGLEALSNSEERNTSGGGFFGWLLPIIIEGVLEWIFDPDGCEEDFEKGYDRVNAWLNE